MESHNFTFKKHDLLFLQSLGLIVIGRVDKDEYKVSKKRICYSIVVLIFIGFVQSTCYGFSDIRESKIPVIIFLSELDNAFLSLGVCIAYYLTLGRCNRICSLVNRTSNLMNVVTRATLRHANSDLQQMTIYLWAQFLLLVSILIMSLTTENTIILDHCLWFFFFNSLLLTSFDAIFIILVKNIRLLLKEINFALTDLPETNFSKIRFLRHANLAVYDLAEDLNEYFTQHLLVTTTSEFLSLITVPFQDLYFSINWFNVADAFLWTVHGLMKIITKLQSCVDAQKEVGYLKSGY